ncbi:MAG: hypothetical protein AB7K71_27425 [Polyangiaceae bacterium]
MSRVHFREVTRRVAGRSTVGYLGLLSAVWLVGCQDAPISLPLRSLERSGEVAFVCRNQHNLDTPGRAIDDCPDYDDTDDGGELNQLLALVTQTTRGEVAVVNLSKGRVEDVDPGSPGFNFLPIGAQPTGIAATPGGQATFVGVGELGREGIFALPTSCIDEPTADQSPRDLTTWSACALPVAPGEMRMLVDPPAADGTQRASCSGDTAAGDPALQSGRECPADLSLEASPPGRRKLLVTLPDWGEVWVLDAQRILNAEPGSFDYCQPDVALKLNGVTPDAPPPQQIPADLERVAEVQPYERTSWTPYPGGIDLDRDTLYVTDRGAPILHRIDVSDVCAMREVDPLLPVRLDRPGDTITTSAVGVSPITSMGKRFVYATDELNGSVMAFDVSLDSANRTPIVRERAKLTPFEPPDRIAFDAPVRSIQFVQRDIPVLDSNGVGLGAQLCDPIDDDALGAEYRPNGQQSAGARPGQLRGIFGMLALTSGQIAVIDVEDYDEPCRRPTKANSKATPDFRGCFGDPNSVAYFTEDNQADGVATVTDEASCNMVETHRARSATMLATSSRFGLRSPGVRALPRLADEDNRALETGIDGDGPLHPKLLATDFADGNPAELFVATRKYVGASDAENVLPTNPASATSASLALVTNEPRAFSLEDEMSLTYEGIISQRPAGYLSADALEFSDSGGGFCSRGVQDSDLAREVGELELGVDAASLDTFASSHNDYISITQPLLDEEDSYWKSELGKSCDGGGGYRACKTIFGTPDKPTTSRDMSIVEAYEDHLKVEPRDTPRAVEVLKCCFPGAVSYDVRVGRQWVLTGSRSGYRHRVERDPDTDRCVRDPDDAKSLFKSRVYEVSCENSSCSGVGQATVPVEQDGETVNVPDPNAVACLTASGSAPADCVFQNLTHRFVVYQGQQPSVRGMHFTWTVVGGFVPLSISLASQSSQVSPYSMTLLPQTGELAVTDAATQGLVMVSLRSLSVSRLFF